MAQGTKYDQNRPQVKYPRIKAFIAWCKAYDEALYLERKAYRAKYEADRQQAIIWWGMLK